MKTRTEYQTFDDLASKVLSIPHSTIKANLDAIKEAKKQKKANGATHQKKGRSAGLLVALLILSVAAQGQQPVTPLTVNGHEVKGKVLEIDGKHFVAVEDLAQSLGGSVSYAGGIALTLPSSSPASPTPTPQAEIGRIKGTLTYFFNTNYGNKPDTGSKVWLLEGRVEIPTDQYFMGFSDHVMSFLTSAANTPHKALKYTTADGNGNFELSDVPVGEYTLIIESQHTKNAQVQLPGKPLSLRDLMGRLNIRSVSVKGSFRVRLIHTSVDFGRDVL